MGLVAHLSWRSLPRPRAWGRRPLAHFATVSAQLRGREPGNGSKAATAAAGSPRNRRSVYTPRSRRGAGVRRDLHL